MKYTFDPREPVGQRIVDITIGGQPLEHAVSYVVGTKSFLLEGKDGYGSFDEVCPLFHVMHSQTCIHRRAIVTIVSPLKITVPCHRDSSSTESRGAAM